MSEHIDTLTTPSDVYITHTFQSPPKANWKVMFGDSTDTWIQFYIKNPPNRFQRWLIGKVFGVRWLPVED